MKTARLNPSGSVDSGFTPSGWHYDDVSSVAVQPDGKIIAVGLWAGRVVRLNPDGTLDPTFNPNAVVDGAVFRVELLVDRKILIGGHFSTVAGVKRSGLARLDSDGSLDQTFVADLSLFGSDDNPCVVYKIAVQSDGKLLLGLQSFGNRGTDDYLIRLHHNGSLDTDFEPVDCDFPGAGNLSISSLAIQTDGRILVGGSFQTVNGVPSPYLARLKGGGASGVRSLRLESVARTSDSRTELSISVPPAKKFVLQASSDLSNWMPLSTNIVPGSVFNFNDRDAPRFSKRFYRVVEEP